MNAQVDIPYSEITQPKRIRLNQDEINLFLNQCFSEEKALEDQRNADLEAQDAAEEKRLADEAAASEAQRIRIARQQTLMASVDDPVLVRQQNRVVEAPETGNGALLQNLPDEHPTHPEENETQLEENK